MLRTLNHGRFSAAFVKSHGTGATYVEITNPAGGLWRVTPSGREPITHAEWAPLLPGLSVTGTLSGSGSTRTLHRRARGLAGRTLTFVQKSPTGFATITTSRKRSGRVKFALLTAATKIQALVSDRGQPGQVINLATPGDKKPHDAKPR